jgi:hypothetical protein
MVLPPEAVLVIQELLQPSLEFALEDGGEFLEHLLQGRHLLLNIRQFPFKPAGGRGQGWLGARRRGVWAGDRSRTLGIAPSTGCCQGFGLR